MLAVMNEYQLKIAKRIRDIRKDKKISQEMLSNMSGVSYASIRRFESSGEISLSSLVEIALVLGLKDDLDNLFNKEGNFLSIEEIIEER